MSIVATILFPKDLVQYLVISNFKNEIENNTSHNICITAFNNCLYLLQQLVIMTNKESFR